MVVVAFGANRMPGLISDIFHTCDQMCIKIQCLQVCENQPQSSGGLVLCFSWLPLKSTWSIHSALEVASGNFCL